MDVTDFESMNNTIESPVVYQLKVKRMGKGAFGVNGTFEINIPDMSPYEVVFFFI